MPWWYGSGLDDMTSSSWRKLRSSAAAALVAEQTPLNRMRDKREKMRRALAAIGGGRGSPAVGRGGAAATEEERMKEREERKRSERGVDLSETHNSNFNF
ncbi:hypothetical protein Acr_00g0087840 [Actinidia rufa]|uniref:Uncharacterized protein n=1 Tax=Actinidia rufa TaxID=165716 RepID=A0A7J0DY09_9ERIC|nr:hypothetical protein Acr_00g0087840 [Actinidia rufa]